MIRNVYLHGEAGKLFGKKFRLDVDTLAEAIRALGVQLKGFRQYVEQRDWKCIRGDRKDGFELGEEDVHFRLGKADLHIIPVIRGSGGGRGFALGKIIAGVLLAGIAFFAAPALSAVAFGNVTYGQLVTVGIGLAITGISQMLSAQPKDDGDDRESGMFSGTPQVATQGSPVPLWYGHLVIRNIPIISVGLHSDQLVVATGAGKPWLSK